MKIEVKCPQCGTEYEADQKDVGKFFVCETCGKNFAIRHHTAKLDVNMASQSKKAMQMSSSSGFGRQSLPLWICVGALVLNLVALIILCIYMHEGFCEISEELEHIEKSRHDDARQSYEALIHIEKSWHNDAEQIYDRMGRMKLY